MRQIKALHPTMAYADDIVIFHNDMETDATEIIKHATELAKHYGLTINADKCRSTQRSPSWVPLSRDSVCL